MIAPLSCNCSVITSPSGPLQIAPTLRLHPPMHQRRPRRLPSPRQSLRNPRPMPRLPPNLRSLIVLESLRLIFICFFDLTGYGRYTRFCRWGYRSMGWGMGVDMKSRIESDFAYCEYTILRNLMIMFFLLVANVFFPCDPFARRGRVLQTWPSKPSEAGVFDIMECITFHRASTA